MAIKRLKPEEIVLNHRQIEVLQGHGMGIADALRQIGVTELSYTRWRKQRAMSAIEPETLASAA